MSGTRGSSSAEANCPHWQIQIEVYELNALLLCSLWLNKPRFVPAGDHLKVPGPEGKEPQLKISKMV